MLSRGHQAADADDLIAATFEVAWRRLDAVPAGREAIPWLLAVARNNSRNAYRKSERERELLQRLSRTWGPSAEMGIDDRSEWTEINRAVAALKPLDRELVLLVAWDELTPAEAGRVLGLRPVIARSRLHRARQKLGARVQAVAVQTPPHTPPTTLSLAQIGGRHDV